METNRESSPECCNAMVGPPSVPKSRGPSLSNARRARGGPPCTTPRRSSSRYSTKLWGAPGNVVVSVDPGDRVCASDVRNEHTAGIQQSELDTSSSLRFEILGTDSVSHGDDSNVQVGRSAGDVSVSASTRCTNVVQRQGTARLDSPPSHVLLANEAEAKALASQSASNTQFMAVKSVDARDDSNSNNNNNNNNNNNDDEAEMFPASVPPPMPHPAVKPRVDMLQRGKAAMQPRQMAGEGRRSEPLIHKNRSQLVVGTGMKEGEIRTRVEPRVATAVMLSTAVQPQARTFLDEVSAWMDSIETVKKTEYHRRYMDDSEKALRDIQRDIEALALEHKSTDRKLRSAKGLGESGSYPLQRAHRERVALANGEGGGADADADACEFADEVEVWRVEKGELLAQKAVLLQKRKELQHHLRRGTNIKSISSMANGLILPRIRDDDSNDDTTTTSAAAAAGAATGDKETIRMRVELKEVQVSFMKLVDSHRVLKKTQQENKEGFEATLATLRHDAAAARHDAERWRCSLQGLLREAEQIRDVYQKREDASIALLLEQKMDESKAVLKSHENNATSRSNSARRQASSGSRHLSSSFL